MGHLVVAARSNPETVSQPLVVGFVTAVAVLAVGGDTKSAAAAGLAGLVALVFVTLPARVAQMTADLREISRSVGACWVEVVSALSVEPDKAAEAIKIMLNGVGRVSIAATHASGAPGTAASLAQRRAALSLLRSCEAAALHPFCEVDREKFCDFARALRDEIRTTSGSEQSILVASAQLISEMMTPLKPFTSPEVPYD